MQPKIRKTLTSGGFPYFASYGVIQPEAVSVGNILIHNMAYNAENIQNINGNTHDCSMASEDSHMVLFERSAVPFNSGVYGGEYEIRV